MWEELRDIFNREDYNFDQTARGDSAIIFADQLSIYEIVKNYLHNVKKYSQGEWKYNEICLQYFDLWKFLLSV